MSLQAIAKRLDSLAYKLRKNFQGIDISLFKGYQRINKPTFDQNFIKNIWVEKSPFSILLGTNKNAIEDAEKLLEYRFRIFSSDFVFDNKIISWHKDVFSGFEYPKIPFAKIRILQNRRNDIIVPWELSRLQFIPAIIQAHRETQDDRYAKFFKEIVDSWISENPYLVGVNWMTGMEVSLRAINLALGMTYFMEFLENKSEIYSKVLWAHTEYIFKRDFAKPKKHRNNHFLISTVGLLALSLCFEGEITDIFYNLARQHFNHEILRQFREDGGNFESAINYHQLSLEAALIALCFLKVGRLHNSVKAPENIWVHQDVEERIKNALNLVSDYLTCFNSSPQFGDSGDSRYLIFKDYFSWDPLDHFFLKDIAEVVLPKKVTFSKNLISPLYKKSGYGFFANGKYGLCLNASPIEEGGHGGHNHCDKTSFVLQVDGIPVFVDSGTYCYTPDIQVRFLHKMTRSHNALMIDGEEQGVIYAERVFSPPEGIQTKISYEPRGAFPIWTMEHNGYSRLKNIGRVLRKVECFPYKMKIEEEIEGDGKHTIDIVFNLHSSVIYKYLGTSVDFFSADEYLCSLHVPKGCRVSALKSYYSRAYTKRVPHDVILITCEAELQFRLRSFFSF